MNNKISHGPLVRFCLNPLIFTMDTAYKGVIAGIGVLILYPLLSMVIELLKKRTHSTDTFYITSFIGVLGGTIYILSIGFIDWGLYNQLAFSFPASMAASVMIIGWLEDHELQKESTPFIEAFILASLIVIFACLRDIFLKGILDLRFGAVGIIYNFGGDTPFKNFEQIVINNKHIWLSPIKIRGIFFFIIASLIALMGISPSKEEKR